MEAPRLVDGPDMSHVSVRDPLGVCDDPGGRLSLRYVIAVMARNCSLVSTRRAARPNSLSVAHRPQPIAGLDQSDLTSQNAIY